MGTSGNAPPTTLWDQRHDLSIVPAHVADEMESLRSIVKVPYSIGCAMNFLFNLAYSYHRNLRKVRFLPRGLRELPEQFIAIHLRFGDSAMKDSKRDSTHSVVAESAIDCAERLGRRLFGSEAGVPW